MSVPLFIVMKKFDFHLRHIYAGRALALAAFATDAKLHRVLNRVGIKPLAAQLPAYRQTQCICSSACDMLLVTSRPIARTHGACVELAASAVVVAHLDGTCKAAAVFPVEHGVDFLRGVFRLETK